MQLKGNIKKIIRKLDDQLPVSVISLLRRFKKNTRTFFAEYDKYSPRPLLYTFRMSDSEQLLFDKIIRNASLYLEFGMGGSTLRAIQISKAKIYSIDSSQDWINLMREYFIIRRMEKKRLSLCYVDIGETGDWGYPNGLDSKELFPNYSASIFDVVQGKKIDVVLVDGRFRVACVLKTILECHSNDKLMILIHDFPKRDHYQVVLKYLDIIESIDTLYVFNLKNNIDLTSVKIDYEEYKYIPK